LYGLSFFFSISESSDLCIVKLNQCRLRRRR